MLKIGITGGIGSGKSIICRIFNVLGIPVYDADSAAKDIMVSDKALIQAIKGTFGQEAYHEDGSLDREYLAKRVFHDEAELKKLNQLVHPVVIQAAEDWVKQQDSPYTLKEAALLFESGSYKKNDFNILVTAPVDIRVRRVMMRDKVSSEQVHARMANQLSDDEKYKLTDYVIINDGVTAVIPQVLRLHAEFLKIVDNG